MEPVIESELCLLQKPGKSDIAGYAGDSVLSDNEEERGTPKDLEQEVLPQLPEAHDPDWEAANVQKQKRAACNKPPQQEKISKKLALVTGSQTPQAEEKPYKCTECGKGFKGYSRFLNHLQTHKREKMFVCVECGKSFSRKTNLVMHRRVHMRERPCKCKESEETIVRTSNFIAHCDTHAKKEAFCCSPCTRNFSGSAALLHHQGACMHENPCRCTGSGNSFCLGTNFIKHQGIHQRQSPGEHTADHCEFTSLHHQEEQKHGAEKYGMDHLNILEELKKMRENMDMLLLNQQSQLQALQEIQKQMNILLTGMISLIQTSMA